MVIETYSELETENYARQLASQLNSGAIVCLDGELGTGKTVFARGFARGLGIEDAVVSPTFTIMQIYEGGRLPLYHYDVYRISDIEEMYELGYEEYFYGEGVCLIEWASLIEELIPESAIYVRIEKLPEKGFDYRKISIKGFNL